MFDDVLDEEEPLAGGPVDFDPVWLDQVPEPETTGQLPMSECAPSGWLALELDHGTVDPVRLSDVELIDTVIGFDRNGHSDHNLHAGCRRPHRLKTHTPDWDVDQNSDDPPPF